MALVLGIDGGGSGCRAALAEVSGAQPGPVIAVIGLAEGGPANIASDPEAALGNIVAVAQAALARAGQDPALLAEVPVVLGLAGANLGVAAAQLRARLPFAHARIVTDAATAAAGALRGAEGIVAAIGTGSVFVRIRAGAMAQFGGHGFRLGDQGSGAVLGRELLARALRAADGFVPMTPLLAAVLAELGGVEGVIAFGLRAAPADYARFAPRIVAGDDPAAAGIFAAAVQEIGAVIAHLQGGADLPVVFLGGLGPAYAAALGARFSLRVALGTGLDGALWLAAQEGV